LATKPALKKNMSAIKRVRQTKVITERNRSVKNLIRTLTKKIEAEVKSKSVDGASAILKTAISTIDKAAKRGILHKNTASRKISRLTRLVNSISSSEAA
jgi:small subunit ribosomal protein S20